MRNLDLSWLVKLATKILNVIWPKSLLNKVNSLITECMYFFNFFCCLSDPERRRMGSSCGSMSAAVVVSQPEASPTEDVGKEQVTMPILTENVGNEQITKHIDTKGTGKDRMVKVTPITVDVFYFTNCSQSTVHVHCTIYTIINHESCLSVIVF